MWWVGTGWEQNVGKGGNRVGTGWDRVGTGWEQGGNRVGAKCGKIKKDKIDIFDSSFI